MRAIDRHDAGLVEQEAVGYRVPPLSGEVIDTLESIYADGATDLIDLSAQALSGSEGQLLGWYLGVLEADNSLWVVVVTLETGGSQEAERIGKAILSTAGELNP